jgi:hypothetical protein
VAEFQLQPIRPAPAAQSLLAGIVAEKRVAVGLEMLIFPGGDGLVALKMDPRRADDVKEDDDEL